MQLLARHSTAWARLLGWAWASCLVAAVAFPQQAGQDKEGEGPGKPKIVLHAAPGFAIAPARIRLTAELRGGADDFEPFYCASVEWDWDDGTHSEAALDCEPFQKGDSKIGRWFVAHHVYDTPGGYRPTFRLKKRGKIVGRAKVQVQIRSGMARLAVPGPRATPAFGATGHQVPRAAAEAAAADTAGRPGRTS